MPPKITVVTAAPERAAAEAYIQDRISSEGKQTETANPSTSPAHISYAERRRRYREKKRAKNREEESSTGFSVTAGSEADVSVQSLRTDTDTLAPEPLRPRPQLKKPSPQQRDITEVKVPVLAHYELRKLPKANGDKEDGDQGLFATQKLTQGTRIISERPLLTLTAPGDQLEDLISQFKLLSPTDQERVWDIRPASPEASSQLKYLQLLVDKLAKEIKPIVHKPLVDRTNAEQAWLVAMAPKLEHAMTVWRLAARWHVNRCSMIDKPMHERYRLPPGTPITGLFIERARVRHSCVPNCFASFDASRRLMNVHVTRDIAPGEELTLAAFADTLYYNTAEERALELEEWGLKCNCEACDTTHPRFNVHEAARTRAHARVILLNDILTRLETQPLPEPDLTTAHNHLLALIRDLKTSRCDTVESVRWRNILVERILPARAIFKSADEKLVAWKVILEHAKECERLGRLCFGEDREEFEVLKEQREASEAAVRMIGDGVVELLMQEEGVPF
ncbi:hypothetical protein E8E13_000445 [Curvularia kusanoi]|uniref:SET domain-containing protein n=1 Tax=Curvularia kusanoi TaxID=90978 RepID=A0A9P4T5H1_CURKU|nr:hypothetical protein E8E13_000445 [Curvularia kusanoi]